MGSYLLVNTDRLQDDLGSHSGSVGPLGSSSLTLCELRCAQARNSAKHLSELKR